MQEKNPGAWEVVKTKPESAASHTRNSLITQNFQTATNHTLGILGA